MVSFNPLKITLKFLFCGLVMIKSKNTCTVSLFTIIVRSVVGQISF